jgi:hypothetical protein
VTLYPVKANSVTFSIGWVGIDQNFRTNRAR